ncbi:MAG: hypothetical protein U0Z44_22030 [Kouleothrix sp.]
MAPPLPSGWWASTSLPAPRPGPGHDALQAWLAARGNPVVLLDASVAGAPLYERLGFVDDEQTIAFVRGDHVHRPSYNLRTWAHWPPPTSRPSWRSTAPIFRGGARGGAGPALYAEAPARAGNARPDGRPDQRLPVRPARPDRAIWAARTLPRPRRYWARRSRLRTTKAHR